ncbi:LTA synthase family protein [Agrilactobacillus yilanensis]|uniref:LTA synthase family protein n=1 Tax=Agrilactobacillus yilanensis TaxID=2485997 RepID=A0ABW4J934_9LACO|nr:LTA synthase family protein [Agrilactobacillus yilanensis]
MENRKKFSWSIIFSILSTLVLTGVVVAAFHLLSDQTYMQGPSFWLVWNTKVLAVLASVGVPIVIGMTYTAKSPIPHRGVLCLLILDLIVQMLTPTFSAQIITETELYLLRGSTGIFLAYIGLLIIGPTIIKELDRHELITIRRGIIIVFTIFVVGNVVLNQDILGFRQGQNLIWYLYLFVIGYWLKREDWSQVKRRQLWLGWSVTLIASGLFAWLTTNKVYYDPHHGLSLSDHYLGSIISSQPLFLIFAVLTFILIRQKLKRSIMVTMPSLLSFGFVLILANNPKLLIVTMSGLHHSVWTLPIGVHLLLILGLAAIFVLVVQLAYQQLTRLNQNILPLKNFKFDLNHVHQYLKRVLVAWHFWLPLGLAWLMTVLSMGRLWSWDWSMIQWLVLHREAIIFVNIAIVFAIFGIFWALFNTYWYAFAFTFGAYAIWLIASFIKIDYRAEPILPSDMSMLTSVSELLNMVSKNTIIWAVIGLALLIGLAIFIQHIDRPHLRLNLKKRVALLLIASAALASFYTANHPKTPIALLLDEIEDRPYFFAQLRGAKLNGTLLQFANNLDVKIMAEPKGYSEARMQALAKKYQKVADEINKTRSETNLKDQTVIFNLSESFADPSRVPNLKVSSDPIPFVHQMKANTASGLMLSSGYGGGTANVEYQTLTGLAINNFSPTLPTPYSQLVPYQTVSPAFTNLFNYKVGIHPFSANLYSRKQVYKKFGFNKFYHLNGGDPLSYTAKIDNSPYISDASAYAQTLKVLNDHQGGQFINLVTMQNHMPFDAYYKETNYTVSGTAYTSDTRKQQIENYIQGIHYTDTALKEFIQKIDQLQRPITLIWYGDHLPGIYNGNAMQTYGLQLHETDYFVYSNRYSRQQDRTLPKTKIVSPNNFPAMALAKMNMKVSPYYALQTKVYTDLPAMTLDSFNSAKNNTVNASSEYVSETGKVVSKLTKKQQTLMDDYQLLQYDITAGEQYALKNNFMTQPK